MKTITCLLFGLGLLTGCNRQSDSAQKARQDAQAELERQAASHKDVFAPSHLPLDYSTPTPSPSQTP